MQHIGICKIYFKVHNIHPNITFCLEFGNFELILIPQKLISKLNMKTRKIVEGAISSREKGKNYK